MDWTTRYRTTRSLSLGLTATGKLVSTNSISREAQEIDLDALPVLAKFAAGACAQDAFERLTEEWDVDRDGFAAAVDALLAQNLLTPEATGTAALAEGGFASPWGHHHMLRDALRVDAYRAAIERYAPGRRVLEIGCGTGILSLFAARAGAAHVDAIEESAIADAAAELFAANPWADRIALHRGNSRDVALHEPAEVLIHELFGTDPFGENVLPALADARERLLAPDARFLPARLEVACVGVDLTQSGLRARESQLAEARAYAERFGLELGPWLDRLARAAPAADRAYLPEGKEVRVLTAECPLFDLDFATSPLAWPEALPTPRLAVRERGQLSALLVFFRARFDDDLTISTAPDAPRTHWGYDLRVLDHERAVAPDDELPVVAEIEHPQGRQRLSVRLA